MEYKNKVLRDQYYIANINKDTDTIYFEEIKGIPVKNSYDFDLFKHVGKKIGRKNGAGYISEGFSGVRICEIEPNLKQKVYNHYIKSVDDIDEYLQTTALELEEYINVFCKERNIISPRYRELTVTEQEVEMFVLKKGRMKKVKGVLHKNSGRLFRLVYVDNDYIEVYEHNTGLYAESIKTDELESGKVFERINTFIDKIGKEKYQELISEYNKQVQEYMKRRSNEDDTKFKTVKEVYEYLSKYKDNLYYAVVYIDGTRSIRKFIRLANQCIVGRNDKGHDVHGITLKGVTFTKYGLSVEDILYEFNVSDKEIADYTNKLNKYIAEECNRQLETERINNIRFNNILDDFEKKLRSNGIIYNTKIEDINGDITDVFNQLFKRYGIIINPRTKRWISDKMSYIEVKNQDRGLSSCEISYGIKRGAVASKVIDCYLRELVKNILFK